MSELRPGVEIISREELLKRFRYTRYFTIPWSIGPEWTVRNYVDGKFILVTELYRDTFSIEPVKE